MIPEPIPLPGRLKLLLVLGAAGVAAVVALRRRASRTSKPSARPQKAPAPGQTQWLRRLDAPAPRARALKQTPAKARRQKAESVASW